MIIDLLKKVSDSNCLKYAESGDICKPKPKVKIPLNHFD
jgi:hypothetical protein